MRCDKCKNCKQVTSEEFDKMSYDDQRGLDCKNLVKDGQCDCYSQFHGSGKQ